MLKLVSRAYVDPIDLLPVFIQVLLVVRPPRLMAKSRMGAMKAGVRAHDIALSTDAFPTKTRQISNAYANQFEMPVLFYVAVVVGIEVHMAGTLFVLLEWLFVAARIGQAFVHTTSNTVALRGMSFWAARSARPSLAASRPRLLFGIR